MMLTQLSHEIMLAQLPVCPHGRGGSERSKSAPGAPTAEACPRASTFAALLTKRVSAVFPTIVLFAIAGLAPAVIFMPAPRPAQCSPFDRSKLPCERRVWRVPPSGPIGGGKAQPQSSEGANERRVIHHEGARGRVGAAAEARLAPKRARPPLGSETESREVRKGSRSTEPAHREARKATLCGPQRKRAFGVAAVYYSTPYYSTPPLFRKVSGYRRGACCRQ
jgi:hypothetical protein